MSVSNYTPSIDNGCAYAQGRLKNVVYFVSKAHLKDVHTDNGQAYIDGFTEAPTRLDCFNIQFEENETLDERYKFTKSLRFSVNGYMNMSYFTEGDLFYAIIKTEDGTLYMINVDFPSRVTYAYNLSANQDQTDFTFSTQSNFPSLRVDSSIVEGAEECKGYRNNGIRSLELIEKNYAAIEKTDDNVIVYTYQGKEFSLIDYLRDTCSLSESYDGERVTDTITFDIAFDNYKTSWHYNLLEFLDNLYAARITPKSATNQFFIGFDLGLQPSYNIQANDSDGQADKITVTLVDSTSRGLVALNDYEEEHHTTTTWRYIKWYGDIKCYECVGDGIARYLLQQEVDGMGNPTGNYRCMEGYDSRFPGLNIVGHFTTSPTFEESECATMCTLDTNMPTSIVYNAVTCYTYNISASCDWNISDLPSYITVNPAYGSAGMEYSVSVCNAITPTSTALEGTFRLNYGNNVRWQNVRVISSGGFITPTQRDITCLEQSTTFNFDPNCPITVTSIDPALTYSIGTSVLTITVPRNSSIENIRQYPITVRDCNGNTQTVYINQDKTYERWADTQDYICVGSDSYVKQARYTGATSTSINTQTGEYRPGAIIQAGDTRCGSYTTKWVFDHKYYCIDGQKTECLEQWIRYGQGEWTKTGVTKLGDVVEDTDDFCSQEAIYSWRQSTKWQCGT